jgi:hypothetical protein
MLDQRRKYSPAGNHPLRRDILQAETINTGSPTILVPFIHVAALKKPGF